MATKPTTSTPMVDAKHLTTPARRTAPVEPAPRPAWLRGDCPSWCEFMDHADKDRYDDRVHTSTTGHITLTAEEAPHFTDNCDHTTWFDDLTQADIFLVQHYREAEPRVWIGKDGTSKGFYLTIDEAEELSHALLDRVTVARDAAEEIERAEAAARAEAMAAAERRAAERTAQLT